MIHPPFSKSPAFLTFLVKCYICMAIVKNNLTVVSSSSSPLSSSPLSSSSIGTSMNTSRQRRQSRFLFQPILTLTLKDPFAEQNQIEHYINEPTFFDTDAVAGTTDADPSNGGQTSTSTSTSSSSSSSASRMKKYFWSHIIARSSHRYNSSPYTNIFNLNSLSPIMLYSIRSKSKPLPNYIPSLHYTSLTSGYKYDDIRDRPSFIEGELKFRKFISFGSSSGDHSGVSIGNRVSSLLGFKSLGRMMMRRKKGVDYFHGSNSNSNSNGNYDNDDKEEEGSATIIPPPTNSIITRQPIVELDIGPRYCFKEKKMAFVVRIGGESRISTTASSSISGDGSMIAGGTTSSTTDNAADKINVQEGTIMSTTNDNTNTIMNGGFGCYAMARFAIVKGKKYLEYIRGSYKMNLPFTAVGSISVTPSYDFEKEEPTCNVIGKSSSGRTAAVIDLNWENPTLSVVHALDERNTISPEISLYDAKILYNWSVALDSGHIKTRIDPSSAIQVTWTDQSLSGKWVTDFKLPLVGSPGPLAGDIRVRRQFEF